MNKELDPSSSSGDPKSSKGKGRVPKRKTWEIEIEDPGNKFTVRVDYPSRGKGLGVGMCLIRKKQRFK